MNILKWFRREPEPAPAWGTVVGHIKDGHYLVEMASGEFVEAAEVNMHHVLAGTVVLIDRLPRGNWFQHGTCS